MMIASNITFLQFAIVVLVLVTRATTGKVAQSMDEASENYHDQVCFFINDQIINSFLFVFLAKPKFTLAPSSSSNQR